MDAIFNARSISLDAATLGDLRRLPLRPYLPRLPRQPGVLRP